MVYVSHLECVFQPEVLKDTLAQGDTLAGDRTGFRLCLFKVCAENS